MSDIFGRILILKVTIDTADYLLINVYNAHTEQDQLKTLQNLSILRENFDNFCNENVICPGDFNLVFNKTFEYKGEGNYTKAINKSYNKVTGSF